MARPGGRTTGLLLDLLRLVGGFHLFDSFVHFSNGVTGVRYFAQRGRGITGAVIFSDVPEGQPVVQAGVGCDTGKFRLQTAECVVAHYRLVSMGNTKGSQLGGDET